MLLSTETVRWRVAVDGKGNVYVACIVTHNCGFKGVAVDRKDNVIFSEYKRSVALKGLSGSRPSVRQHEPFQEEIEKTVCPDSKLRAA